MKTRTDQLASEVEDYFLAHASEFGLAPATIDVRPIFNWGGFTNFSFRIRDHTRDLHLKLATSPESQSALARWNQFGKALECHHAPPILAEVQVGEAYGLLFPTLSGGRPEISDDVLEEVMSCLHGLWSDRSLASKVSAGALTAADFYRSTYHRRLIEDLRLVQSADLPFLAPADVDVLRKEVTRLHSIVGSDSAFLDTLSSPTHGDLWPDNIIWNTRDSWYIVDWDAFRIGDPAMDVVMLTGPTAQDLRPVKRFEWIQRTVDPEVVGRAEVLGRASLLDWVIDPLADWIEAETVVSPDRVMAVRKEKERIHRNALELYHDMYGLA